MTARRGRPASPCHGGNHSTSRRHRQHQIGTHTYQAARDEVLGALAATPRFSLTPRPPQRDHKWRKKNRAATFRHLGDPGHASAAD